jgi:hypothetical protein
METAGKVLLLVAFALAVIGVVLLGIGKLGFSRVPGDIVIRRGGLTVVVPLGSMLLLSLLASLLAWLIRRL